ncbi:MAG: hypothetical protein ACRDFX_11740 [Chloroflexota bacterium]
MKTVPERRQMADPGGLDLTAEIPGLSLVEHALRERPRVLAVMRHLEEMEEQLRETPAEHDVARVCDGLFDVVIELLAVEEEMEPVMQPLPVWSAYKWLVHAASWISASRIAQEYAVAQCAEHKDEAILALSSGLHFAAEAAVAYCRFDTELLMMDARHARDAERP